MSGTARSITLRLDIAGAEKLQNDLRAMGAAGEEALRRLEAATQRAGQRGGGLAAINDNAKAAGNAFGAMTPKIQQAGYQLQDFFVQIQGGTAALTAMSQQGSQFLGAFGPGGAIAGAVLAIGALAAGFLTSGDNAETMRKSAEAAFKGMKEAAEDTRKVIADIDDLFLSAANRATTAAAARIAELRATAQGQLSAAIQLQDDAALGIVRRQTEIERLERLKRAQDETLERQRRAGVMVPVDENNSVNDRLWTARAALQGEQAFMARMQERVGQLNESLRRLDTATPEMVVANRHEPAKGRAERAPGDVDAVLARLREQVDKEARQVADGLDPAAKAFDTLTDSIDKLRRAESLWLATQDREGGPLGIAPERVEQLISMANNRFAETLNKTEDASRVTTRGFDQFFGRLQSGFEQAITNGKNFGDIIKALEKDIAALILRLAVLNPAADAIKGAYNGAGGFSGIVKSLFGGSGGANYAGAGTLGHTSADSLYASMPAGPSSGGWLGFANGGVMTPFGPLPLRKYAAGGVARSPQVAIYGENRQPEAYVPLPDGRSIPVSMKGGGGGPVINIDARGAEAGVEQRIDAVLARRLPAVIAASRADITARVNRGGSDARTFGRR